MCIAGFLLSDSEQVAPSLSIFLSPSGTLKLLSSYGIGCFNMQLRINAKDGHHQSARLKIFHLLCSEAVF